MSAVASEITSVSIVCSTVGSGADQRNHQTSASLAFVRRIHRWPVNSRHKRPVTRKKCPFDDVMSTFSLPSSLITLHYSQWPTKFREISRLLDSYYIEAETKWPCKWHLWIDFLWTLSYIVPTSLNFVPGGPIDKNTAVVQIMAWRRTGDKPLSEPMMTQFIDAYMRRSESMS